MNFSATFKASLRERLGALGVQGAPLLLLDEKRLRRFDLLAVALSPDHRREKQEKV
jgi:hypothetical protein